MYELFIEITVIESQGYTAKGVFTISVIDDSDPPNDISLSANGILNHDLNGGTLIGYLSVSDQDNNETFTYSIDNPNLEIIDGYLRVKANSSISGIAGDTLPVSITVTDSTGNSYTETFELVFSALSLDNFRVDENSEGAVVATISISTSALSLIHISEPTRQRLM